MDSVHPYLNYFLCRTTDCHCIQILVSCLFIVLMIIMADLKSIWFQTEVDKQLFISTNRFSRLK